MPDVEHPYNLGHVQQRILADGTSAVYGHDGQLGNDDPEILVGDNVALIILGYYVVVKGDVEKPDQTILAAQVPELGIKSDRKVRRSADQEANSTSNLVANECDLTAPKERKIVGDTVSETYYGTALYLGKLAKNPMFDPEDRDQKMTDLSAVLQKGLAAKRFLDEASESGRQLNDTRTAELLADAKLGDHAKQTMVLANLRLAVYYAKRFNIPSKSSLTFDDLIQEMNQYFIERAEQWNPKLTTFATFAGTYAVRRLVLVSDYQANVIRLPHNIAAELRAQNKYIVQREAELGRSLSNREKLAIQEKRRKKSKKKSTGPDLLQSARRAQVVTELELSNNLSPAVEELTDTDNDTAKRRPKRTEIRIAEDTIIAYGSQDLGEILEIALLALSAREASILRLRFGLVDGKPKNLNEIGIAYGLTGQRIGQIQAKALSTLRHSQRLRPLRMFLDCM